MIKLQFLGPVTIHKGENTPDQTIPKGALRVALLAYLTIAKPRGYHRRDKLLALLWPNSNQKSARNSLSNVLYHIRDALGKNVILNRGSEEISINPGIVWCDVLAFQKALDRKNYYKAFQIYNGKLLSGFHIDHVSNDFQEWLDGQRVTLQNEYVKLCWRLAEEEKNQGYFDKAYQYIYKAADFEPYSEEYQFRYLNFLIEIGKRHKALEAFDKFSKRLKNDLNTTPSESFVSYIKNLKDTKSDSLNSTSDKNTEKPKQDISDSSSQKTRLSNSDPDSITTTINHQKDSTNRFNRTLVRNVLILTFLVLGVWLISKMLLNQETDLLTKNKSVAVLPFTYINSPDSTDYFSLGITEEILSKLARVADLSVTSRTSVMQYQYTDKSIREIARELGVSSIVEGSVQRHMDEVRITAQLIDAETDRHLWGDTYDRNIENILNIQSDVASRIADALQSELLSARDLTPDNERNVNVDAYHLYLQAKHLLDIREPKGVVESIELYKESIAQDSTFAPAYGELALATIYSGLLSRYNYNVTEVRGLPMAEAMDESYTISNKALTLDSTIVEAHLSKALIYQWSFRDWERSEKSFLQALQINANHADVRREYGFYLLRMGEIEEATVQMEKAVSLDPLSWAAHHGMGYTYYCSRNYEEAIRELETSINLGSLYPNTKKHLSLSLLKRSQELFRQNEENRAIQLIETGSSLLDEIWGSDTGWKETVINAAIGNRERTLQSIETNTLPFPPRLYSLLLIGEKEAALAMLEQRLNFSRDRAYVDPIFDAIREDPKFKQMVRRDLNKEIEID